MDVSIFKGPARSLIAADFVNAVGTGLYLAVSVLFLIRIVGLTLAQVGLAVSVSAAAGMVASAPLGYLADRRSPRLMLIISLSVQAVSSATLVTLRSFPAFMAVSMAAGVALSGGRGAQGALIAQLLPPSDRIRVRAFMRAAANAGLTMGAAVASIGLIANSGPTYTALILGNAATFIIAAFFIARMPRAGWAQAAPRPSRLTALRDLPFMAFTVLDGMMSVQYYLQELALPFWIVTATNAPRWLISVLICINTAGVLLLQVPATRGTETASGAARAARRAGLLLALACGLYAFASAVGSAVAMLLLVTGAVVHLLGELLQAAAGWSMSFQLAPAQSHGEYQATYSMSLLMARIIAPVALTTLVVRHGPAGWLILAGVFAVTGLLMPIVMRWAIGNRPSVDR